jgi:tRNA modification GTPase
MFDRSEESCGNGVSAHRLTLLILSAKLFNIVGLRKNKSHIPEEVTMKYEDDTIAAIATPIGEGGIAVVRVSGKQAFEIVDRVFRGKTALKTVHTHTAHVGYMVDLSAEPIDEVVVTVYRTPHSYTGEDSVEISCHGGLLVTRRVLESALQAGARMAEPGEFTKRAFINGRLDLLQA